MLFRGLNFMIIIGLLIEFVSNILRNIYYYFGCFCFIYYDYYYCYFEFCDFKFYKICFNFYFS